MQTARGTGRLVLEATTGDGPWTLVVMRPDGSPGVQGRTSVGATLPSLPSLAAGLVGLGALLLLSGAVLLLQLALPERSRPGIGPPDPADAGAGEWGRDPPAPARGREEHSRARDVAARSLPGGRRAARRPVERG